MFNFARFICPVNTALFVIWSIHLVHLSILPSIQKLKTHFASCPMNIHSFGVLITGFAELSFCVFLNCAWNGLGDLHKQTNSNNNRLTFPFQTFRAGYHWHCLHRLREDSGVHSTYYYVLSGTRETSTVCKEWGTIWFDCLPICKYNWRQAFRLMLHVLWFWH